MGKKSQAQLKRLRQRAEARGEIYVEPSSAVEQSSSSESAADSSRQAPVNDDHSTVNTSKTSKAQDDSNHAIIKRRKAAAQQLQKSLEDIVGDSTLKAKDRRSAKRKAEAIASEHTGLSSQELLDWYQQQEEKDASTSANSKSNKQTKKKNPYVAFIGQLSYQTTAEALFAYLQKELGDTLVTSETVKVRLLTKKQGEKEKSRGMAFVETSTPELLYSCLSLHHTYLDGRRINVEKTAGGRNPVKRQSKINEFRQDQQSHQQDVIRSILQQHNLQEGTVIDAGVVELCQRHAPSVVQAALERFDTTNGLDKDNPSAYLTFLLTKLGQEGIFEEDKVRSTKEQQQQQRRPTSVANPKKRRASESSSTMNDSMRHSTGGSSRRLRQT